MTRPGKENNGAIPALVAACVLAIVAPTCNAEAAGHHDFVAADQLKVSKVPSATPNEVVPGGSDEVLPPEILLAQLAREWQAEGRSPEEIRRRRRDWLQRVAWDQWRIDQARRGEEEAPPSVSALAQVTSSIPTVEREALIALYTSTNGAGWVSRTNWRLPDDYDFNEPGTECTWHGIQCDPTGSSVAKILLSGNNLEGVLPPSIADLANLDTLWVSHNHLSGGIPKKLATLVRLELLWLNENEFSGPIPPELGSLKNLRSLALYGNQLSGSIPVDLSKLTNLESLSIGDNQLTGSIPPQLGALEYLDNLRVGSNRLTGPIPVELGDLTNLQNLYLHSNQLTGPIPPELGNLARLEVLWLNNNRLSGEIPAQLGNLANLEFMALSTNQLSGGIPPDLGNLSNLEFLVLQANQLSGPIPAEIGNLAELLMLWVSSNRLTGILPATLMSIPFLTQLDLRWNGLFTSDPELVAFLNGRQWGGDWQGTQTIAPEDVAVAGVTETTASLTWTPIPYTDDIGEYRGYLAATPGGPYTFWGSTADKATTGMTVEGLVPGTEYYAVVRTVTGPHDNNANAVFSVPSQEVFFVTDGQEGHVLTVLKTGVGIGTVTSAPTGIDCGEACAAGFDAGTVVTLTATPQFGSGFDGWSGGGCSGTSTCNVTMDGDRTVTAQFRSLFPSGTFTYSSQLSMGQQVTYTIPNLPNEVEAVRWHFGGPPCAGEDLEEYLVIYCVPQAACSQTSYRYATAGSKTVQLEFYVDDAWTHVDEQTVEVVDLGGCGAQWWVQRPEALLMPDLAARIPGLAFWESSLSLYNPGEDAMAVELFARTPNNRTAAAALELPAAGTSAFDQVLDLLLADNPDIEGRMFALWLRPAQPGGPLPVVSGNTFTARDGGTYGQALPVVPVHPAAGEPTTLWLTGGIHNGVIWGSRTNLTIINPSDSPWGQDQGITLTLVTESGTTLSRVVSAAAASQVWRYNPITRIFNLPDDTNLGEFTLKVEIPADISAVVGASVNDNITNDSYLLLARPAPKAGGDSETIAAGGFVISGEPVRGRLTGQSPGDNVFEISQEIAVGQPVTFTIPEVPENVDSVMWGFGGPSCPGDPEVGGVEIPCDDADCSTIVYRYATPGTKTVYLAFTAGCMVSFAEPQELEIAPTGGCGVGPGMDAPEALLVPDLAARISGLAFWESSLHLYNPGEEAMNVDLYARTPNNRFAHGSIEISPAQTKAFDDVLDVLLADNPGIEGRMLGLWLRPALDAGGLPVISGTTFTRWDGGRYGQALPVVLVHSPAAGPTTQWVTGAVHSGTTWGSRTNLTVINPWDSGWGAETGITLTLYREGGAPLTAEIDALAAHQVRRYNPITRLFGLPEKTDLGEFTLKVEIPAGISAVVGASVNDNITNDSYLLLAQPEW